MENLWRKVYTKKQEEELLKNILAEIDKIRQSGVLKNLIKERIEIKIEDEIYMHGSVPTGLYLEQWGGLSRLSKSGDGEYSDIEWHHVVAKTKREEEKYLKDFVVSPQDIITLQKKLGV